MQNNFSAPHNIYGKKLDRLSATIPSRLLGISLKLYQRLAFRLAKEVRMLSADGDVLV